ncbi:hypothetical protein O7626_38170 [Micromonospora sp. WMMD1102]|uniref:hypothetical protein n=1 Tax=Micromonospora sp. WMMD1102 TaxID=3016105 RepID=UPI002414D634|nr:hypothetical protein [Micromonospora sp. WMMD1102]MDG4791656.1 hypothetical protein [Micromonospora sp. WMMD1102]
MDAAIAEWLRLEVGHPEPFWDEELDKIVTFGVRHARSISGLERCRSLEVLVLSGYGCADLPDLSGFSELSSLKVADSELRDIGPVRTAPSLLVLNVERSLVTDISVTLECTELSLLDVTGNPLSDVSYREVLPELRAKGVDVHASDELDWSLTRALHESGLPFAFYQHADGHRLSRPGLTHSATPEAGHVDITPQELAHLLATSPEEIEPLFDDRTRISGRL